jgi:uncharacterized protein (TIGR00255 family)
MPTPHKKTTLNSMTGFGIGQATDSVGTLHIELRSVNSRFLELHFKVPDAFRQSEALFREVIGAHLRRGKVECRLSVKGEANQSLASLVNSNRLEQILALESAVCRVFPQAARLSVAQILAFESTPLDPTSTDERQPTIRAALDQALADLVGARAREGERLSQVMRGYVEEIGQFVAQIEPSIGVLIEQQQRKLAERLAKALAEVDPSHQISPEETAARVRQEVAALGLRADVAEELQRLKSHCQEFRFCLDQGGVQGKKLDFLLQEFNREANTLGSKALSEITTNAAIGLKQRIEQLREQIQNIE